MRNQTGRSKPDTPWLVWLIVLLAVVWAAAGCATHRDSDIPWNQPQPWEGSPMIPGLSNP